MECLSQIPVRVQLSTSMLCTFQPSDHNCGLLIKNFWMPSTANHPSPKYDSCLNLLTYVTLYPVLMGPDIPRDAHSNSLSKIFMHWPHLLLRVQFCFWSVHDLVLMKPQSGHSKMNMSEVRSWQGFNRRLLWENIEKLSEIELVISGDVHSKFWGGCWMDSDTSGLITAENKFLPSQ